jgi:GAF domain-containing protein
MSDNMAIQDLGAIAFAGVPLTDSDGLVLGTLAVIDQEPRAWTPSEVALLTDLGEICSSELRLRIAREIADEARRHAESAHDQLTLLAELTDTLAATMDIDEALSKLGRMVAGRVADWCFVALAEPSGAVRHVSVAHHDPAHAEDTTRLAQLAATVPKELKALVAAVQRTARPIRADAARPAALRAPAPAAEIAGRIGFASYLLAPITAPVGPRIVGVVALVNGPGRGPFGEAEERTAEEIGRRAGLAVDNSRLYGRQRHVAEVLQHSMLPELPQIPGVELYARYLPAQVGAAVGGDWYDAFAQPDGSVMLAVGDVSGHDIEAAATMGQVRNLVRGDAYGRDDAPGPLLAQLDRALHGLAVPAAATAVLARLSRDGDAYALAFANAGHPPPIMLRPDGEVEVWWEAPEPLLGLLPLPYRTTHRRRIAPGSTLLLYTDGLVEHPAQLIDDGIDRLHAVLRGGQSLPPDELCSRLIETATRRDDDIALLVIRFN